MTFDAHAEVCYQDGNVLQCTLCSFPYRLLFLSNHIEDNVGYTFSNHTIEKKLLFFKLFFSKLLRCCFKLLQQQCIDAGGLADSSCKILCLIRVY